MLWSFLACYNFPCQLTLPPYSADIIPVPVTQNYPTGWVLLLHIHIPPQCFRKIVFKLPRISFRACSTSDFWCPLAFLYSGTDGVRRNPRVDVSNTSQKKGGSWCGTSPSTVIDEVLSDLQRYQKKNFRTSILLLELPWDIHKLKAGLYKPTRVLINNYLLFVLSTFNNLSDSLITFQHLSQDLSSRDGL